MTFSSLSHYSITPLHSFCTMLGNKNGRSLNNLLPMILNSKCRYCPKVVPTRELGHHEADCSFRTYFCGDCGEKMLLSSLSGHKLEGNCIQNHDEKYSLKRKRLEFDSSVSNLVNSAQNSDLIASIRPTFHDETSSNISTLTANSIPFNQTSTTKKVVVDLTTCHLEYQFTENYNSTLSKNDGGKKVRENMDIYKGNFLNDKRSGVGVFTNIDGKYNGRWADDRKNGKGRMECINGDVYEGDFLNDMYHGFGEMTYVNGATYEGWWVEGMWSGEGVSTNAKGQKLKGMWKSNVKL